MGMPVEEVNPRPPANVETWWPGKHPGGQLIFPEDLDPRKVVKVTGQDGSVAIGRHATLRGAYDLARNALGRFPRCLP